MKSLREEIVYTLMPLLAAVSRHTQSLEGDTAGERGERYYCI
jgi:hypothetical protein